LLPAPRQMLPSPHQVLFIPVMPLEDLYERWASLWLVVGWAFSDCDHYSRWWQFYSGDLLWTTLCCFRDKRWDVDEL